MAPPAKRDDKPWLRLVPAAVATALFLAVALLFGHSSNNNRVQITGPTAISASTEFAEVVSGQADGVANFLISGEQLTRGSGCALTYLAEAKRPDWRPVPSGTGPVLGSFRLSAQLWAADRREHGLCAYLVSRQGNRTYARSSQWWNG